MPWLRGFRAAGVGDVANPAAGQRISGLIADAADEDYGGFEVRADLVGDAEPEVVLASYHRGIVVLDASGQVLARAPGFEPGGSADDLLSIAVGDGHLGAPVIVVAAQSGGHRESTISLTIYRMTGSRTLQPVFSAPIEEHVGDDTRAGSLTFLPSGLRYLPPDAGRPTLWAFNVRLGRYLELTPRGDAARRAAN
jgi:hypothetical protein